MKYRSFLSTICLLAVRCPLQAAKPAGHGDLAVKFHHPPEPVKPWTCWHWMSGNITRTGISRDLEAMKNKAWAER